MDQDQEVEQTGNQEINDSSKNESSENEIDEKDNESNSPVASPHD